MRLPNATERHAIIGTTGSGKTVFGLWCLSHRNYHEMPWIIYDFKRDDNIAQIPRLEEIRVNGSIPKRKGLYVMRPDAQDIDDGTVTESLYNIWRRENTGVFIDEGYMIPRLDKGLRTLLTQGRSKHIPMISLSQRPSYISPFLLSESEFKSVFYLQHPADIERVNEWMPACNPAKLPDHASYWYQRDGRIFKQLKPCEPMPKILERFDKRVVKRTLF